jgi:L-ascorbate metabolism protein UlaG (beta-lactamase superfamily)
MIENITWLGHAAFRIDGPPTVYIDPFELPDGVPPTDLVLITHGHHDHYSPEDLAMIVQEGTLVVSTPEVVRQVKGKGQAVQAGDKLSVKGIALEVVPAYNLNKHFHPGQAGHVGFIVTVGGQRIYHSGDTDVIPEMDGLQVDIALLPVGGKYTMTAEEAAQAVRRIKPRVAIPMHYGAIVGTVADAQRFKKLCPPEVEVVILEKSS